MVPMGSGPMQANGDFNQGMGQDRAQIINLNDHNGQWNTDRNGHVPFMGY